MRRASVRIHGGFSGIVVQLNPDYCSININVRCVIRQDQFVTQVKERLIDTMKDMKGVLHPSTRIQGSLH